MDKPRFSEVCESASRVLHLLAEQSASCTEPVLFDRQSFQPNIALLAEVLTEFGKVKLEDFGH